MPRRRRHLRGRLRRLVLRLVRGLQAGEGSRRRPVPDPSHEAGLDPREELLLPAVGVSRSPAGALRGASGVPAAGRAPQRDPAAARSRARGHLGQPRRAVVGHPAAVRSGERRLRLVRRADQLHRRGRLRHRRTRLAKWWPADLHVDRQGHHAVPRRGLAGDADERRRGAAAAGLRPRLGALQGREDEQVARHGGRSARSGRAVRPRSAAALPGQGEFRSAATATSRGSGSRSATTSTSRTTSATSSAASPAWRRSIAAGASRRARRPGRWPPRPPRRLAAYRARWTLRAARRPPRVFRLVDAANEYIAETEPWALAKDPATDGRSSSQVLFDVAEAVRVAAVLLLPVMPASAARDPAAGRRDRRPGDAAPRPTPRGARRRADAREGGGAVAAARSRDRAGAARTRNHERSPTHAPRPRRRPPDDAGVAVAGTAGRRRRPPRRQAAAAPRPPATAAHHDRRLHEGRSARREGADRRARAEVEEAGEADRRRRHRAADARRRHRRGLRAGGARRPHHRHRRQPEAGAS